MNGNTSGLQTWHARITHARTIDTNELAKEISKESSFTESDVKGLLAAFHGKLVEKLCRGERLHLEVIGYFSPTLRCRKEAGEITGPEPWHTLAVEFKTVKYRPEQRLKDEIENQFYVEREKWKRHSPRLDAQEVDSKVRAYLESHRFITRKDMETLFGFMRTMALTQLNRMKAKGTLRNENTLRNPVYVLNEK